MLVLCGDFFKIKFNPMYLSFRGGGEVTDGVGELVGVKKVGVVHPPVNLSNPSHTDTVH